jgi:hypothetical protein
VSLDERIAVAHSAEDGPGAFNPGFYHAAPLGLMGLLGTLYLEPVPKQRSFGGERF